MAVQGAAAQGPHAHWLWRQGGLREAWRGGCRQTDGRGWPDRQQFVMVFELNITRQKPTIQLSFNHIHIVQSSRVFPNCCSPHTATLKSISKSKISVPSRPGLTRKGVGREEVELN